VVVRGPSAKEIRRDSAPCDCARGGWSMTEIEGRPSRGETLGERWVGDREGAVGVVAPLRDGTRDAGCD
jgi:hypothetical protein